MIYETQAGTIKGSRSLLCCPVCSYLHFTPGGWILKLNSHLTGKEVLLSFVLG